MLLNLFIAPRACFDNLGGAGIGGSADDRTDFRVAEKLFIDLGNMPWMFRHRLRFVNAADRYTGV